MKPSCLSFKENTLLLPCSKAHRINKCLLLKGSEKMSLWLLNSPQSPESINTTTTLKKMREINKTAITFLQHCCNHQIIGRKVILPYSRFLFVHFCFVLLCLVFPIASTTALCKFVLILMILHHIYRSSVILKNILNF